jgi:hypothetical protein
MNLTVATKIIGGFTIISLFLIATSFISLNNLSSIQTSTTEQNTLAIPTLKASNTLANNTEALSDTLKNGLISPLVSLSNRFVKTANNALKVDINSEVIAKSAKQTLLPKLFSKLCQQAKAQLTIDRLSRNEFNQQIVQTARVCDQDNALWLSKITATEQEIANVTSYIVSAYPVFLARRCQGACYATQALTIENTSYFVIYSAFDVAPDARLKEIAKCLLSLSEDKHFINASLALAKTKYCRVHQVNSSKVKHITAENISNYLQAIANNC